MINQRCNLTKIHILTTLRETPYGGGNQFLKSLKKYFKLKGIYTENPEKADIIIFNSFPFNEIFRFKQSYKLKKKGKILIHRVDGPISKSRGKDLRFDKILYKFNHYLADGTIYQSNWSKSENLKVGIKSNRYETVIYNAPDKEIFNTQNKREFVKDRKIRLIASSWSDNWNKGFKIYKFLDDNLNFNNFEMTFIGNSPIKFKNIKWIKPLNSRELAAQLKLHDIYITASKNDPCSNALIEALHCNLPALALKDGGHPELIKDSGLIFKNESEIISKLEQIIENYSYYQNNINLPSINEIGENYYNFMSKIYYDYKNNKYFPKTIGYVRYLLFKLFILVWNVKEEGVLHYMKKSIKKLFKNSLILMNY